MNFKILPVAIMVAASLAALASMPIAATPAYAGGNVHVNNVNNHATDTDLSCTGTDISGSCNELGDCSTISGTISDSCNTTPATGGGGGGSEPPNAILKVSQLDVSHDKTQSK